MTGHGLKVNIRLQISKNRRDVPVGAGGATTHGKTMKESRKGFNNDWTVDINLTFVGSTHTARNKGLV